MSINSRVQVLNINLSIAEDPCIFIDIDIEHYYLVINETVTDFHIFIATHSNSSTTILFLVMISFDVAKYLDFLLFHSSTLVISIDNQYLLVLNLNHPNSIFHLSQDLNFSENCSIVIKSHLDISSNSYCNQVTFTSHYSIINSYDCTFDLTKILTQVITYSSYYSMSFILFCY